MGFESPLPLVENPKIDIFWWMIWIRILFQLKVCEPCCNFWSRSIWWKISCIWWLHFFFGHFEECFQNSSEIFLFDLICQCLWESSTHCVFLLNSLELLSFGSRFFSGFFGEDLGLVGVSEVNFSASALGRMLEKLCLLILFGDPTFEEFLSWLLSYLLNRCMSASRFVELSLKQITLVWESCGQLPEDFSNKFCSFRNV
jgi:hypothetical protein